MTVKDLIRILQLHPDDCEVSLMTGGATGPTIVVFSGKEGEPLADREASYILVR